MIYSSSAMTKHDQEAKNNKSLMHDCRVRTGQGGVVKRASDP